jgi:urea transport system substrate-binding protein
MGPDAFHPSHYAAWSYFQSLPSASNRRFVAAFKARFGADRVTSDPVEASYVGVLLWARAVHEAGTEMPEHVNRTIIRQSIAGPSGTAAVDAATRHLWKNFRIGRALSDGQFAEVAASEETIRPTPFPGYRSFTDWQQIAAALETKNAAGHREKP